MSKTKKIVLSGILLALLLVLSRFLSIKTPLLVISFSFIPTMMSAIILGPKYSTIIAGLGDFIGAILFPFGTYFPGFTLSAVLTGLIHGLILYRKPGEEISNWKFILKLVISSVITLGCINILLTSWWLNIMYGKAYIAVLLSRVTAQVIMLPIQVIVIFAIDKALRPVLNKYLYNS